MSLTKDFNPATTMPSWVAIPDDDDWWSDEPQLETSLHLEQILLLVAGLKWWWRNRNNFFVAGNISIYYEKKQGKQGAHRFSGPDFFVVKDVSGHPRRSWMVWKEDNRFPNLIIEILSKRTAKVDRTDKKRLYQNRFKTPEYFWFHPWTLEFAGFKLVQGNYQPIPANARGHLWSEELQAFLGLHERKLRFFTPEGNLVPLPEEDAVEEKKRRHTAEQQAEQERQQREVAQKQVEQERQQREVAQQQQALAQDQLSDLALLLEQYRDQLPAALRARLEDENI